MPDDDSMLAQGTVDFRNEGRKRDDSGQRYDAETWGPPRDDEWVRDHKVSEGDPVEVHPADSRAESQPGLNGPGGSPTSPSGRVSRAANSQEEPVE